MRRGTNSLEVKKLNRNRIFRYVHSQSETSMPDISAALDISGPTVLTIVKELKSAGVVEEVGELKSTGGRKAKAIASVRDVRYAVGMDITENHVGFVYTDLGRKALKHERIRKHFRNEESYFREIGELLGEFVARNRIPEEKIEGINRNQRHDINLPGLHQISVSTVKPVKAGSSYGVTKVTQASQLSDAIALAFKYDTQVILEENIEGFEVGCAVLGNQELTVGEVDEIELSSGFFDFTEKYTLKTSAIHVPARIAPEKAAEIKETAKRIYLALGCRGFARVDMFLTPEGKIVFNEANTIPGFTSHSRYPGMMKAAGHSFGEILTRIIELAFEE